MGKPTSRKQVVRAYEKGSNVVPILLDDTIFRLKSSSHDDPLDRLTYELVMSLSECKDAKDQVTRIQGSKSSIRSLLNNADTNDSSIVYCLETLLTLYLLPTSTPLRKALDFVSEFVTKSKSRSEELLIESVRSACRSIMERAEGENRVSYYQIIRILLIVNHDNFTGTIRFLRY
jgi:hypothetical protein